MPPLTLDQYDRLWAISEIPMCVVNLDDRFVRCNRAYCSLIGYSESELRLRKWQQITHPDDLDGDTASVAALRADNESNGYDLTKRYLTKSGKVTFVQLSVLAVRDDTGNASGYFISAIPIASDAVTPKHAEFSLLKWATQHPKDTAIFCLGGGLLLGRDTIIELLKLWINK